MKNKRIKIDVNNIIDPMIWNSASSVHNYMLDDPIIDYLNLLAPVSDDPNQQDPINSEQMFFDYITDQGNSFEKDIISAIEKKIMEFGDINRDFIRIAYNQDDIIKIDNFEKTKNAIQRLVPIIYQGVLHDPETKTYGSPDLIIRNDYLEKIFTSDKFKIPEIQNKIYYVIVDIKLNKLKLLTDGFTLANYGRSFANKGQLLIYNRILTKIQKIEPPFMYVLGSGYSYTRKSVVYKSSDCFEILGHVQSDNKELNEKVDKALEWLSYLKENYNKDSFICPMPNMANTNDCPFHNIKKEIAKKNEDLTLMWSIGNKNRAICNGNGIYKLSDPKLSSSALGITNSKTAKIIDAIIKVNLPDSVNPVVIDCSVVIPPKKKTEYFIDIETVPNDSGDFVFMIGLYVSKDQKEDFYNFTAEELSNDATFLLFDRVHQFLSDSDSDSQEHIFYHWGSIEKQIYEKVCSMNKHRNSHWSPIVFYDLLELFRSGPIVVKGAYSFSLKEIGTAMYNNGLLKTSYKDSDIISGLTAMVLATRYHQNKCSETGATSEDKKYMDQIIEYNKIDCIILYEILLYLRNV